MDNNINSHIQSVMDQIKNYTGRDVTIFGMNDMFLVTIENGVGVTQAKISNSFELVSFLNGYLMGWISNDENRTKKHTHIANTHPSQGPQDEKEDPVKSKPTTYEEFLKQIMDESEEEES